jgi:hypothetical protein
MEVTEMGEIARNSWLPAHFTGQHQGQWTDLLTALLLLVAVAGLAIVVTGRRARIEREEVGRPLRVGHPIGHE